HLKIDPDRFWVSVFAGDPELGLDEDEVAYRKWEEIGQPPERIVLLPRSENFWDVGGPGPCGPDTEMFYDWGTEHGCGEADCKPGCTRCERFLEFWNLVFMEFELHADGKLTPLPKQNVDTGMGVERTAAVLQNVMTVYETDVYQAIMRWIADESGVAYGDSPEATKIHRILSAEEERFGQTLARGMRLFEEIAAKGGNIPGEEAFRLHDTYGFPLELTRELGRERGLGVNEEEFTRLMAEQRERSRAAISRDDQRAVDFAHAAGFRTEFVGYEKTDVLTQLGALEQLEEGLFLAKLRASPFYPAGGGQVTDA